MDSTTFAPRFEGSVNARVDAFTLEVTCRELAVLERLDKLTFEQKRRRLRLHIEMVSALRRLR